MNNHNEILAHARLQNVAHALAYEAADALEPDAGQPIDTVVRDRLAHAFALALNENLPPLRNLLPALV
ncbi:TPA: hypothetical protein QDB28_002160 [Burkholderia vietnamiensis]|nr:hypothetical protein [Burkholderia vietnamiensis]